MGEDGQIPLRGTDEEGGSVSVLRDAKALIEDPSEWIQGQATDERGRHCAVGALWFAAGFGEAELERDLLDSVAAQLFPESRNRVVGEMKISPLPWVNDNLGHEAVMQVFDKAIVETEGGL